MGICSAPLGSVKGYGYLFFAPNWEGALSLLFPHDPGGRLLPPQLYRFEEVGVTFKAARPWPRPGTLRLCLELHIPMKVRNRIIFTCCRARAGRFYLQHMRA